MVEIQNLGKNYDSIRAVNNISFKVHKGEKLGFLGVNGAGKSTTMNMITGHIPSSSGSVKVCGFDIRENPIEAKKHIGYLPESPPLYIDMTVTEFLNFVSDLKRVNKRNKNNRISEIIEMINLKDVRHRVIKNLSKGYKQRVGIAQALIGNPEVVILDEPTVGLDPTQIIEIRNLIKSIDKTVILSSHILPEISVVCERVVIIDKGEIIAVDTPSNLSGIFEDNTAISVTAVGDEKEISNIIKSIDGIMLIEAEERENNAIRYRIEYKRENDLRGVISTSLAGRGYPILELKSLDRSLEDIFIKLVSKKDRR